MSQYKPTKAQRTNWKHRGLGKQFILPIQDGEAAHHFINGFIIGIPKESHRHLPGTKGDRQKEHRSKVLRWLESNDRIKFLLTTYITESEIEKLGGEIKE